MVYLDFVFQKIPGVVKVLSSFDIPQGGVNDIQPPQSLSEEPEAEEVLSWSIKFLFCCHF